MFNKTRKYIFFPVLRCCNSASITVKFPRGMGSYTRNQWHTLLVCRQDGFRLQSAGSRAAPAHSAGACSLTLGCSSSVGGKTLGLLNDFSVYIFSRHFKFFISNLNTNFENKENCHGFCLLLSSQ